MLWASVTFSGMPAMRVAILFLCSLLLSACWQVKEPVVARGVKVDGLADGLYQRSDGSEVMIRWNGGQGRYDVGMTGGAARVAPLGGGLFLVDYSDAVRLAVVARIEDGTMVIEAPTPAAEERLAMAHGLSLRHGPVRVLAGTPEAVRALAADVASLAGTGELVETDRLTRIR